MAIKFKNPWGSPVPTDGAPLDIQRSDLWALDLGESKASSGVTGYTNLTLVQALGTYYDDFTANAGSLDNLAFYPKSVSFPEIRLNPEVVPVYSTPYNFPGHDEATPVVRIVFRHPSSELKKLSPIQYILSRWFDLCRTGRGIRFNSSDNVVARNASGEAIGQFGGGNLTLNPFLLKSALNYRVPFKFDIVIRLYRGNRYSATTTVARNASGEAIGQFGGGNLTETSFDIKQMVPANIYTLQGAWISGLQLSDLDYESNTPMTVSASLYVDNIVQEINDTESEQPYFWSSNGSPGREPDFQPFVLTMTVPQNVAFRPGTGPEPEPPTPTVPDPPSVPARAAVDATVPIWEHWQFWKRWQ